MKQFKIKICLIAIMLFFGFAKAQVTNTGLMDTIQTTNKAKISIGGYLDTYYGGISAKTTSGTVPYFVSMADTDEFSINLAYIDLKYQTKDLRIRVVPGFGTYMNANYAAETGTLKNLVEASAGVKIAKNKEIWLDAGVLGSPYTNESAISKDHLMYTRSLAPEYVPYYLCGVKLSVPLSKKTMAYFYLINGWQQINDNNKGKSIGTQLEYRPNEHHLINWNTYLGNENSISNPNFGMRYFTDVYWIYTHNRFSATSCFYIGYQELKNANSSFSNSIWWQANLISRYKINEKISLSGRVEYFNDKNNIQIIPITSLNHFNTFSTALCFNLQLNKNAMFRLESRHFLSDATLFLDSNANPTKKMTWLVANLTFWF